MSAYQTIAAEETAKAPPRGRRVVLVAAASFGLGAGIVYAAPSASKALRGSTNLAGAGIICQYCVYSGGEAPRICVSDADNVVCPGNGKNWPASLVGFTGSITKTKDSCSALTDLTDLPTSNPNAFTKYDCPKCSESFAPYCN